MEKSPESYKNICFRCSADILEAIQRAAKATGQSQSDVFREMLRKGLTESGFLDGAPGTAEVVRAAVEETLKPQVERLAAISAKAAQIGAAAFFLAAYNGSRVLEDWERKLYDYVVSDARKAGVEYLKLSRDASLDDFIKAKYERAFREK